MGQTPHYLQDTENPAAIEAPLTHLARLLNLTLDMSQFPKAVREFRAECDRAVAKSRSAREHVKQLEQEYDSTAGEEHPPLPAGEIDSDRLIQEIEDFLRKQQEGARAADRQARPFDRPERRSCQIESPCRMRASGTAKAGIITSG